MSCPRKRRIQAVMLVYSCLFVPFNSSAQLQTRSTMRPLLTALICLFSVNTQAQETSKELGETLVIGNGEIIASQPVYGESTAALRVFRPSDDGWQLTATYVVDGVASDDRFGSAMDLDGDLLAVSAADMNDERGAVYLFTRNADSGEWTQLDRLAIEDSSAGLGTGVDLYGSTLLAGAPGINTVLVVHNVGTESQSQEHLTVEGLAREDRFGASVVSDGERVYVGAPGVDSLSGAIYVFNLTDSGFEQEAVLTAPDYKGFGKELAVVEQGTVLSPAPGLSIEERFALDGGPIRISREAFSGPVFELRVDEFGEWAQTIVADSLSDNFLSLFATIPLAVNQDRLVIGMPRGGGKLQVYTPEPTTSTWTMAYEVEGSEDESGLGFIVAMDGDIVASAIDGIYDQGAIVVLAATDSGMVRTGQVALVEDIPLARSGRVDCEEGAALHFGCSNVDLLAYMPIGDLGGEAGIDLNDIWGWTDPETGVEYALVGRTNGTAFVDISNPSSPVYLGSLPLTEGARPSTWRDIKVYDDHAFVVSDGARAHGMQVFDLSQLRDVATPPAIFEPLTTYDRVGSAHNVVINESTGYAYIVGAGGSGDSCGGGLHMVNIQDPANPVFAGCFADTDTGRAGTGYSHDAQCVMYNGPDTDYSGKEVCFNSNENALSIADVTDKANPVAIANAKYPNARYAHQGWLTDDHSYFYMNDELDETGGTTEYTRTLIWDVADLDDPQLVREFLSENKSSDHNLYIRGNLMYQSNYASGLRIFDISDFANPVEVGFFDTITVMPDAPGFIGSWSNYPYFESGTIVVTSMEEGLFVLKKREVDT